MIEKLSAADLDLILFDCDGVLTDSEIIACRIDAEEFTALGIPMTTKDVIQRFAGISGKDMRAAIERDTGRPLPRDHEDRIAMLVGAAMMKELKAYQVCARRWCGCRSRFASPRAVRRRS